MAKDRQKVLIVGAGGVGVIAALGLSLNGKTDVTLVIRSDYEHVLEKGYTIHSCTFGEFINWKPHNIAKSVEEAFKTHGEFDFIVLTTKNVPDGPMTCEDIIRPAVTPKAIIVLLQNGIDIEKPMFEQFPQNIVLSGVSMVASTNSNCHVRNLHKDTIYLGAWNNPNIIDCDIKAREAVNKFIDIYQYGSNNEVIFDHDVKKMRWEKLLYNSVLNTTTSIVNMDINRCQMAGANDSVFRPAMYEIVAIAASEGVQVTPGAPEWYLHISDGLFYSPSMCVDMRKDQLMELEVILGNPLRIAEANKVATPTLSVLYSLLKMIQFRIKESRNLVSIDKEKFKNVNSDNYPSMFG